MAMKIRQKLKTNLKLIAGIIVLLLTIIFLPMQVWAGERWDRLSLGVKSTVGNIVQVTNHDAGKYIKTTDFGVGQRIGSVIDNTARITNTMGSNLKEQKLQQTPFERSGALIGVTYETKTVTTKVPDNSTDANESKNVLTNTTSSGIEERFKGGVRYVAEYLTGLADNVSKSPVMPISPVGEPAPNPFFALRAMHDYIKNQLLNEYGVVVNKSSSNESNYTTPFPGFGTPHWITEQVSTTRVPINESEKKVNKSARDEFADGFLADWMGKKQVVKEVLIHKNSFGVGTYTRMESRTEYTVTDPFTNKTTKINESVFRSLLNNGTP